MAVQQWYEKRPERLQAEAMAVQTRFPGFTFRCLRHGDLTLVGKMRTVSGASYQVVLIYPPDYPLTSPKVYPIPRLSGPHQFQDGSMCLFRPDDRFWQSNSTAVTVLAAAALWLSVREHWLRKGTWLGAEH